MQVTRKSDPRRRAVRRLTDPLVAKIGVAVVAITSIITFAPSPAAVAANPVGVPITAPCDFDATVLCGKIRVPVYWQTYAPGDPTFRVEFRLYPKTDPAAVEQEPVVGFAGGPGQGSISATGTWNATLGPLRGSHPLLVMDYRGTGASQAIICDELQHATLPDFVDQSAACGAKLGDAANAYGNAASSRDLAAIIEGLGIPKVDLYGTSAGSIAAASFAANFPELTRAAVLDGAYDDKFDPFLTSGAQAMRNTWTILCERSGACDPDHLFASVAALEAQLQAHPFTGHGRNSFGGVSTVVLNPANLARMMYDGTFSQATLRDFPAAVDAFLVGNRKPLVRIGAEIVAGYASGGAPRSYSYGYYQAVYCRDNPPIWDRTADFATRLDQLNAQIDALPDHVFAPFSKDAFLHHQYEYEAVFGCLRWPAPPFPDPALPVTPPYPDVPTLVLNGEMDFTTPPADAEATSERFPNGTYVEIANAGHVVARSFDCARTIFQTFIQTLQTGDTSCKSNVPPVLAVPTFAKTVKTSLEAHVGANTDASTLSDRRMAWAATWTLGETLARQRSSGFGLRGGSYRASGGQITFTNTRFVSDLAVNGSATYDRTLFTVTSNLILNGPGKQDGTLSISFSTHVPNAVATITGTIAGRTIYLVTPAPWATRA